MSEKQSNQSGKHQPKKLLSYYIPQNEWTTTTPRGPVASMYKSPGPAIVMLPSTIGSDHHDYSKYRSPTYKIGIKTNAIASQIGPGPGAYDIRGYTNKGFDRCCAPLMGILTKPIAKFESPGPAAYSPELHMNAVHPKAPVFSCRLKANDKKIFCTPAPNAYTLPPVLGLANTPYAHRAPGYTMGYKTDISIKDKNPGPGAYMLPSSDITKCKAPIFTMPKAEGGITIKRTPGPADYASEDVRYNRYSTPKCSFGIRHSPYEAFPRFAAEK